MAEEKKEKKGVVIPKEKRQPNAPEYLHMSYAEVQEAERERIEKVAKIAAYAKDLEEGKTDVETKPDVKKPGRPAKK